MPESCKGSYGPFIRRERRANVYCRVCGRAFRRNKLALSVASEQSPDGYVVPAHEARRASLPRNVVNVY